MRGDARRGEEISDRIYNIRDKVQHERRRRGGEEEVKVVRG